MERAAVEGLEPSAAAAIVSPFVVTDSSLDRNLEQQFAQGARVGPYDVLGPLGQGGMGAVFRARDAKLRREVAIKVLPESFARDPDRKARF